MELASFTASEYSIKIREIESCPEGYICYAPSGKKHLRLQTVSADRIMAAYEFMEYLSSNNYNICDHYISSERGMPYMEYNGGYFTLSNAIEGRECDFNSAEEIRNVSYELAKLHNCMKGFRPAREEQEFYPGRLELLMKKKLDELRRHKHYAMRRKTDFDYFFLKAYERSYEQGCYILERLAGSRYRSILADAWSNREYCHGDLTFKNIIIDGSLIKFRGFEHFRRDAFMMDLIDIMRKSLEKCAWNVSTALYMLDAYSRNINLGNEELDVIETILKFPWRLVKISNKYYNSKKSWASKVYIPKICETLDMIKAHSEFKII